jgi:simple sugar transport system permease protein
MADVQLMGLLNATLQAATLLFIAALGELITEKTGLLNLGVEGMISIGAVTGFMTAINTENLFLAIIVGIFSASLFASLHAFVTELLKQDHTQSYQCSK